MGDVSSAQSRCCGTAASEWIRCAMAWLSGKTEDPADCVSGGEGIRPVGLRHWFGIGSVVQIRKGLIGSATRPSSSPRIISKGLSLGRVIMDQIPIPAFNLSCSQFLRRIGKKVSAYAPSCSSLPLSALLRLPDATAKPAGQDDAITGP